MVIHAHRDIEAGEEITLNYVATEETYKDRQTVLKTYGMQCSCEFCKAEASLPQPLADRRNNLQKLFIPSLSSKNPRELEITLRECLSTYQTNLYKEIPYVGLARRMLHLGHLYLGPVQNWVKARPEARIKAADCFIATLELCLGIILIKDPKSPYCELGFSEYCQPAPSGVFALVGLAELAVTSGDITEWTRTIKLISLAKLVYKLHYGQDATFDDHHKAYLFRIQQIACPIRPEEIRPPNNWDEIKASAMTKGRQIPSFLR